MNSPSAVLYILSGAGTTLAVTLIALPVGMIIGLACALMQIYGISLFSQIAKLYSAVIRGVPPVVLLFILYYEATDLISLSPLSAGIIATAIISSAYQAEIFRGSIIAVGKDQELAGRSLGMDRVTTLRYIIIPQALSLAIAPWSNEAVAIIQNSSLVYALGVQEILRRAHLISSESFNPILAYGTAALFYFSLTLIASYSLNLLEKKISISST